ncbi:YggT family protein [Clostridium sp. MSJ-4]|uniref:YggT family protein n=1 Tax=Clostridium simiarum TaxID=2841506 RepID=A0ABS6EX35_9CLOT|nr:YggT family protein [Clostridium simiarum]
MGLNSTLNRKGVIFILRIFFKILFTVIEYVIFLEVILSFIFQNQRNKFLEIVRVLTDPLLRPAKALQEKVYPNFPIDFSPVIVISIIYLLQKVIMPII